MLLLVEALCRLVFHQIDDSSINNVSRVHLTGIRLELEGPSSPQHRAERRTSCRSRSGCCRPSVNVDRSIWSSALRAWDDQRSVFNTAFPFGEFSRGFIYNKQVGRGGGGAGTPSSVLPSSHLTLSLSHRKRKCRVLLPPGEPDVALDSLCFLVSRVGHLSRADPRLGGTI